MNDAWTRRVWQEWEVGNLTRTFRDALLKIRAVRAPGKPVQPSHKFLAARTGCCRKTVQRALRAAQRLSLLDWCERRIRIGWRWVRTTNDYRFMVPAWPATKGQFGPGELHEKKQGGSERHPAGGTPRSTMGLALPAAAAGCAVPAPGAAQPAGPGVPSHRGRTAEDQRHDHAIWRQDRTPPGFLERFAAKLAEERQRWGRGGEGVNRFVSAGP
jgi:hypothetical protein